MCKGRNRLRKEDKIGKFRIHAPGSFTQDEGRSVYKSTGRGRELKKTEKKDGVVKLEGRVKTNNRVSDGGKTDVWGRQQV